MTEPITERRPGLRCYPHLEQATHAPNRATHPSLPTVHSASGALVLAVMRGATEAVADHPAIPDRKVLG